MHPRRPPINEFRCAPSGLCNVCARRMRLQLIGAVSSQISETGSISKLVKAMTKRCNSARPIDLLVKLRRLLNGPAKCRGARSTDA